MSCWKLTLNLKFFFISKECLIFKTDCFVDPEFITDVHIQTTFSQFIYVVLFVIFLQSNDIPGRRVQTNTEMQRHCIQRGIARVGVACGGYEDQPHKSKPSCAQKCCCIHKCMGNQFNISLTPNMAKKNHNCYHITFFLVNNATQKLCHSGLSATSVLPSSTLAIPLQCVSEQQHSCHMISYHLPFFLFFHPFC